MEEVLACTAWEEGAEEPAWDQEVEGAAVKWWVIIMSRLSTLRYGWFRVIMYLWS